MILLRALVALVVLAAAPALARAQGVPAVGVTYTRGPGAEGCPDETGLRESITGRVGSAVDILGSTANVPKKIAVRIERERRLFVSRWEWSEGGDPPRVLKDENCYRLVERTAVSIAVDIKLIPAPAPPLETEPPPPAPKPVPSSEVPPSPPPSSSPAPPAPPPPPKPGVFEGPAGIGRVAAFAVTGVGVTTGTGFAVAAVVKAAAAQTQLAKLVQMSGASSPCFGSGAALAQGCANVAQLHQGCGSLRARLLSGSPGGRVVTERFLGLMESPVIVPVAARAQRAQSQHSLCAG